MKFFLASIILAATSTAWTAETIIIRSPVDHNHAGNPALQLIIAAANQGQNQYTFIMTQNPGGQGTVALRQVNPQKDIALIHPSFVHNSMSGAVQEKNWIPVGALGDACFLLISQQGDAAQGVSSLEKSTVPLMVGVVGLGSAAHLLALEISYMTGISMEPVMFNSAGQAVLNLIAQPELTMALGNINQFRTVHSKKPTATALGALCPTRHPDMPETRTFQEQGINTPLVFNILIAHTDMPRVKREQIAQIWDRAVKAVGKDRIFAASGFISPHFDQTSIDEYARQRIETMRSALEKHKDRVSAK